MSVTFASLSNRNYKRYFIGLTTSNIGQWMARTAQAWLVLVTLTGGNASMLGWLTTLSFAPTLLLAPIAGSIADRVSKRTIMNAAASMMAIDAIALSTLVLTGHVQLWHVFLLAGLDGTAAAFDGPARQAFVSEVVPLSMLPNAISLNSASFNGARLLGPGIAGVLIAAIDTGPVLALNVLSFAALIVSLSSLNRAELHPARAKGKGGLIEGVRYVRERADLKVLLFIAFMFGTFGFNGAISNAVMATEAFGKGPSEYGMLGSWMGLGALTGALASARRPRPRLRYVLEAMAGFAIVMCISAIAPNYWSFAALLVGVGFTSITCIITANSLVQMSTEPAMRGRVMSLWGAVILGGVPFVSPVIGWIGDTFGPRWTVAVQGIPIGITFVLVTMWIMRTDQLSVVVDRNKRAPWLRLVRGQVTEDVQLGR
ncbi:MFS transporter [Aestuariimicrobium kwangyangense]|uniref:MFS transporter n=1 Tax=Aestuariimicrobium kwangyangense TaxID=396389 RepID=UPI0003B6636F|nr:MFS transporter [Aestuariimicrobium kwangyangense]